MRRNSKMNVHSFRHRSAPPCTRSRRMAGALRSSTSQVGGQAWGQARGQAPFAAPAQAQSENGRRVEKLNEPNPGTGPGTGPILAAPAQGQSESGRRVEKLNKPGWGTGPGTGPWEKPRSKLCGDAGCGPPSRPPLRALAVRLRPLPGLRRRQHRRDDAAGRGQVAEGMSLRHGSGRHRRRRPVRRIAGGRHHAGRQPSRRALDRRHPGRTGLARRGAGGAACSTSPTSPGSRSTTSSLRRSSARALPGLVDARVWSAVLGVLATAVVAVGPARGRACRPRGRPADGRRRAANDVGLSGLPGPWPEAAPATSNPAGWLGGFDIVVGYQVSWLLMFADYPRYTADARRGGRRGVRGTRARRALVHADRCS